MADAAFLQPEKYCLREVFISGKNGASIRAGISAGLEAGKYNRHAWSK
jgi:hypothetical protein